MNAEREDVESRVGIELTPSWFVLFDQTTELLFSFANKVDNNCFVIVISNIYILFASYITFRRGISAKWQSLCFVFCTNEEGQPTAM